VSVVVVGAGIAGTAAALAASRAGARVTVVDGGAGASALWTGGVDGEALVSDEGQSIAAILDVLLGDCTLVTSTGLRRPARGRDAALLDAALGPVGVVRCDRPGWDADLVARAAGDAFVAIDCTVLRHSDERVVPDADFAARHDDEARLLWLSERLREGLTRAGTRLKALLLPPSLGIERARAGALSKLVGLPCGEATAMPGGPPGLRFERARQRALSGVTVLRARATGVERAVGRWRLHLEDQDLDADAVVVAAGGLVGGGLEYQPSEAMLAAALPPTARHAFRCTVDGPLPLGAHGRPLDLPGSLFGVAPESLAWPLCRDDSATMDRVGVLCDEHGRVAPGLYAAGEIVADAPRTWLAALESGARAGADAARDAVRAPGVPGARPASAGEAPASRP